MKKIIISLLIFVIIFGLTGCGEKHMEDINKPAGGNDEWFNRVVKKFNQSGFKLNDG